MLNRFYKEKIKFEYVDGLIKHSELNKYKFLCNLGIGYNSYKTDKYRGKFNNSLDILLKHFQVNDVLEERKPIYNRYVKELYYSIYFKEENKIKELLEEFDNFISDDNYLKPIFILFKLFGYINLSINVSKLKEMFVEDVQFLSSFNKNYFIDEYQLIYYSVMYFFDAKINFNKFSTLSIKYPKYKWIYLLSVGSYCYLNKKDNDALDYYLEAYNEFEKDNNLDRMMMVSSNISLLYNALNKYSLSLNYSDKIIKYIYSTKETKWISYGLQHYLFSYFMLDEYNIIIDLVSDSILKNSNYNIISNVIVILSYYKLNKTDLVNEMMSLYKGHRYIELLKEYFKTKDIGILEEYKNNLYLGKLLMKL